MTEQIKHLENCLDSMLKAALAAEAKEYNQRLIEEAKNTDDEIPEKTDEKCLALIGGNPRSLSVKRVFRVMLVAIVTVSLLITMSYAVYLGSNIKKYNAQLSVSQNSSSLTFEEGTGANASEIMNFAYVPDSFYLFKATDRSKYYTDDVGNTFHAACLNMTGAPAFTWDTENATIEPAIIKGCDGFIARKTEPVQGKKCVYFVWYDSTVPQIFFLAGAGVDETEMFKVLDGISF